MNAHFRRWLLAAACLIFAVPTEPCSAEVTDRHRELAQQVFEQLLAAVEEPTEYDVWPPQLVVMDDDVPNAFARIDHELYRTDEKLVPLVAVHSGEIERIAEWEADALAFTIGHELGHVVLGHILPDSKERGDVVTTALSRDHEQDADRYGMELALKAGFSYRGVMQNLHNTLRAASPYCSVEGLTVNHPPWNDRIARLDEDRPALWHAMSAFDNGVYFLTVEQHENAAACFRRVTREFPDCYEAWANLGYAQLMQYCDKLDPLDMRFLDVGQLVVGGFYRRPESLETQIDEARGFDEGLWYDAVGSLREALRLKEDLLLAKANLAVAYLVKPEGKDVGKAAQLFDQIAEAIENKDRSFEDLDPIVRAALLVNSSVSQLTSREPDLEETLQMAEDYLEELERQQVVDARGNPLRQAMKYNRALSLASSDDKSQQQEASKLLEEYLQSTPTSLAWWTLAYDQYAELCKRLGTDARSQESLTGRAANRRYRVVTSVQVGDDVTIALADPLHEVQQRLGSDPEIVPVVSDSNLKRVRYPQSGVEILALDRVVAIFLTSPDGPAIELRNAGLTTDVQHLRVGMTKAEFEALLGDDRPFGTIVDAKDPYRFYQDVGIAVKFRKGKVIELSVAPMARG